MRLAPRPAFFALLFVTSLPVCAGAAGPQSGQDPATEVKRDVRLQGDARSVLEQLGRLFGVRVETAEGFPGRRIDLRLGETDLSTALRVATQLTDAFWVLQADGSVLVASATPENRAQYEPKVRRTFSLPGRTPEELTEAMRLLREVLDMRLIRSQQRGNTVTVFDTPFRLAVAEEFLAQLPSDPGEVQIEVLFLEIDRQQAQQLGILPPDRLVAVHLGAGALSVRDTDSLEELIQFLIDRGLLPQLLQGGSLQALLGAGMLDPSQLATLLPPFILVGGGATTYAVNLPGAQLTLMHLARVTRSWRQLSLRTRAGEEASLFIGERFPIVFTTFSSIFIPELVQELIREGQFVPPVPAVRYEELGVRVTVTPQVHSGGDVSLSLKIEQKSLTGQEINGIPVLSNRTLEQQVRLREGESLILAGFRRDSRGKTRTGTPGLGSLPVIGHLFRRSATDRQRTELLILVTPRLVRLPASEGLALRVLHVGTETEFSPGGPTPPPTPTQTRPEQPQRPPTPPGQPGQPQPQQPPQQPPRPQPQQPQPREQPPPPQD